MMSANSARTRALFPSRMLLAVFAGALLPTTALAQDDDNEQEIIVTAPLDRRLRLGPLPPEDADGEAAYAREVRLSALPLPLRQLSEEECEERGLTTRAAQHEHAAGASAAAAATAAPR